MINIFITEEIPSLNKGEAAILKGMLNSFKKLGEVSVSMISFNLEEDILRHDNRIKIVPFIFEKLPSQSMIMIMFKGLIFTLEYTFFCLLYMMLGSVVTRFMKAEIWKTYCESDILICGHDALLEDRMSKNFKSSFNKKITFISTFYNIILARLFLKKKVVVYGGSIGRFKNKLIKVLAKIALNKVDLITLREKISHDYLNEIGVNKDRRYVTADLAFSMEPVSVKRAREILLKEDIAISNNRNLIGLSASKELYHFMHPRMRDSKYKYREYIQLKVKIIDYLIEELNAIIILIPHSFKKEKDDRIIIKEIYDEAINKDQIKLILNEYSPEEFKGIIGLCNLFMGDRTHSNIAAVSMGVPTIIISEPGSHRNKGIFTEIIGEKFICEIGKMNFDQIIKIINYTWENRNKIRQKLMHKRESLKARALYNGDLLKKMLSNK